MNKSWEMADLELSKQGSGLPSAMDRSSVYPELDSGMMPTQLKCRLTDLAAEHQTFTQPATLVDCLAPFPDSTLLAINPSRSHNVPALSPRLTGSQLPLSVVMKSPRWTPQLARPAPSPEFPCQGEILSSSQHHLQVFHHLCNQFARRIRSQESPSAFLQGNCKQTHWCAPGQAWKTSSPKPRSQEPAMALL